jgi:hypothetical protein
MTQLVRHRLHFFAAALALCTFACAPNADVPRAADGDIAALGLSRAPQLSAAKIDANDVQYSTRAVAAQVGYYATPAPGQAGALNGADMGWAFTHKDKIWVMFGDSWWLDPVNATSSPDDALGQISLDDFPDGASVDAFVSAHPARAGEPAWRAAGPTMPVVTGGGLGSGFAPVVSTRFGKPQPSGIGRIPIAAFSNGRSDEREAAFAVFFTYEFVECIAGRCADGYDCDTQLGTQTPNLYFHTACVVGSSDACRPGPGLCQDRGSSIYDASSPGARANSVVLRNNVGAARSSDPVHFKAQPWESQRFINATARTVRDFDPARAGGVGNDYTPALGNDLPRAGVILWGRPHFGGVGEAGRDARLYLLWSPLPEVDSELDFEWQPQYFTGLDQDGRPQFSPREFEARPLDLDATTPGDQPEESRDLVGQMGISWLPSLQQFVMIYGGGGNALIGDPLFGEDAAKIRPNPHGSLYIRFASQPWGPWTPPREFLQAGDRSTSAEPEGQYAPGGLLAHNRCNDPACAHHEASYLLDIGGNNNGCLYGASIIDAWTTSTHIDGTTDIHWFVSTWNPYQVVLMKTSFSH